MKAKIRQLNSTKENHPAKTTQSVEPTLEEIRQRAHEIFRARGARTGNDLDDWLRAEQQLKQERAAVTTDTTQRMRGV